MSGQLIILLCGLVLGDALEAQDTVSPACPAATKDGRPAECAQATQAPVLLQARSAVRQEVTSSTAELHRLLDVCSTTCNTYDVYGEPRHELETARTGEAVCCDATGAATRKINGVCTGGVSRAGASMKTYAGALAICEEVGMTLCETQEQLDTTCGSGCQTDCALAWIRPTWPPEDMASCTHSTKQKAMYAYYEHEPTMEDKPATHIKVSVKWEEWANAPWKQRGGVYAAWPFKTLSANGETGPAGYFGAQVKTDSAFIFSVWDGHRFEGTGQDRMLIKSDQLVWPLGGACARNCQDCGLPELRPFKEAGFTTGTKCLLTHQTMNNLGEYEITFARTHSSFTINTRDYGGVPVAHSAVDESDRDITGARWRVTAADHQTGEQVLVGDLLFEGGDAVSRITSFDEMLGCNKCNDVYHRDTRTGPFLHDEGGAVRKPTSATSTINGPGCGKYRITGNQADGSITFEGGPGAVPNFEMGSEIDLW